MRLALCLIDALQALAAARGRTATSVFAIGVAVSTMIVAGSYGNRSATQVDQQLSLLDGTLITVSTASTARTTDVFPLRSLRAIRRLPGVRAAGLTVDLGMAELAGQGGALGAEAQVYAMTDGVDAALGFKRGLGELHLKPGRDAVVLGTPFARRLGIRTLAAGPGIAINGRTYGIVGTLDSAKGLPQALQGALVPYCCGRQQRPAKFAELVVDTLPGVTQEVAARLPTMILPSDPRALTIAVDASPVSLRRNVSRRVGSIGKAIGWIALVLASFATGLLRFITVKERTSEFGVRAALGARQSEILWQVTWEGVCLGACGAGIGVFIGAVVSTAIWGVSSDMPLAWSTCAIAWVAGLLGGVAAGLVPAVFASRIAPARAVRAS